MPLVNYCKKCKAEVPLGENCAYCGGKLVQAGEQLSFGMLRTPVRDWFAWNGLLRILLPVLLLVCVFVLAAEAVAAGQAGVLVLIEQGFLGTMLWVLGLMLGVIWLLLVLQGPEKVHVIMDRQGVHVRTYLPQGRDRPLYARFLTPAAVERLAAEDERPPLEGLVLARRITLPWEAIRRVRVWREGFTLLFFRPAFWQAAAVNCPAEDLAEAEALVRKKLKKYKTTRVYPLEKEEKKKKR